MKIAALGDIHGNYQALITIIDHVERWRPDLVLVLGDIINRGPRSRECLHLIQEKVQSPDWHLIKGNHEGYVLQFEDPEFPRSGVDFDFQKVIYWTYDSLSREDIQAVIDLPEEISLNLPGNQLVRGYHASSAGNRIGIYPDTPDSDFRKLIDSKSNLFLVGHTHQPFVKTINSTTVINVGSIGLPFDGDTRPAYAQITLQDQSWQGNILRVDYDREAAERDFFNTGFIPEGGPIAELVLAELKLGWPQLSKIFQRHEYAVREGLLSLEDAALEVLRNPNIEYLNSDL
ncbi:MAG: metallophosphoesterase [Anaerolineales bacterium]|nr:metallophosphoesterase [Anaerolineales bacterium]